MDVQLERKALYDLRPDETAPNRKARCRICETEFAPMSWNVVRNGNILRHRHGFRKGKPIRMGNFVLAPAKEQPLNYFEPILEAGPICYACIRDHRQELKERGIKLYPYGVALHTKRRLELKWYEIGRKRKGDDPFGLAGVLAPLK